jgi:hypothetical protein
MRDQEIVGLWESYLEVCDTQQLDELSDELVGRAVNARIARTGAANDAEMRDRTPENMRNSVRAGEKEASMKTAAAKRKKRITKEEVETWVNDLIEEGYDLSEYTWDDMYEMYVTEGSNYDKNRQRAAKRAAERNAARDRGQTGNVPGVGYVTSRREGETYRDSAGVERHTSGAKMPKKDVKEDVDIFDVILEHLVDEGYADTNKSALAIMANMSEEWREEILDEAITSEKGKAKAAEMIAARSTPSGRAKSGKGANVAQIRKIGRSNREGLGGTPMTPTMAKNPVKKKNYDGTGNKAARRAGTYSRFGYKDPSNK